MSATVRRRPLSTLSKPSSISTPSRDRSTPLTTRSTLYDALPHFLTHPCTSLSSFFSQFGSILSRHQVPSLLLTALIICSLLSPSLLLYFAPSSPLSTSPLARRGRGELVWELEGLRRQGLIATEEEVCWERVKEYYEKTGRESGGRRLRVEQVLINLKETNHLAIPTSIGGGGGGGMGGMGGVGGAANVLSGGGLGSGTTISKSILHKSWKLQNSLEKRLLDGSIPGNQCLRDPSSSTSFDKCTMVSPMKWWESEQALLGDQDVHETLSNPPYPVLKLQDKDNSTAKAMSLPLTVSGSFVGVGFDRSGQVKTAQSIILTFFLLDVPSRSVPLPLLARPGSPVVDNSNSTLLEDMEREESRASWRKAVREVIEREKEPVGVMSESKGATRHVLLKFLPHLVVEAHPRRLENIIYAFGYLLVIIYVGRYIRRLRAHSKMGLIVTGIAELCSSGIMSVSICWLMGWNLGLVPWNLMAFLVLTSGLDNMILVLRAISQTDLNLPVPERMAVGLKQVGVEMTVLLMVEELIAAWLLWFVEITVMRQWIRFGAVVLAVDYFLELTFFSTVLSIDIQRLELADLLAHNTSTDSAPSPTSASKKSAAKNASSPQKQFEGFIKGSWKVLKDRPAKTSTVAFLWVVNVLLWTFYGSEHYLPATCSQTALSSDRPFLAPSLDPSLSRDLRLGQTDPSAASHLSVPLGSGESFWNLLNPSNASSVQIYLEPTISVQLFDSLSASSAQNAAYRSPAPESIQLGSVGAGIGELGDGEVGVWTKVMIVVLPILLVMGLLRMLLWYLLKDAELLQARWGSEERVSGREKDEQVGKREKQAEVEVVKGIEPSRKQHKGDVELLASGGQVIASWAGLEEEVHVRRRIPLSTSNLNGRLSMDRESHETTYPTRLHIPLAAEPVSLTALSVDSEGKFCAAVTNRGRVLVWALERNGTLVDFGTEQTQALSIATPGPVLINEAKKNGTPAPPTTSSLNGTKPKANGPSFYSLHAEGKVVKWSCGTCQAETVLETDKEEEEIVRRQLITPTNTFEGSTAPLLVRTYKNGRITLVALGREPGRILFDLSNREVAGRTILAVATFPIVSSLVGLVMDQSIVASSSTSSGVSFYTLSPSPVAFATLPDLGSSVRQLRLSSSSVEGTCPSCLESIPDGFLASVSTRSTVKVFRIFTPPISSSNEPCVCNSTSIEALEIARSRASSFVNNSPAMTRVLSNGGTTGRRFSPRKKPTTPTRPVAFNANPSTTMSVDPSLSSMMLQPGQSSSSNESSTPGSPTQERRYSLSPAPPPKRSVSSSSLVDISPASTVKSSPESPPDEASPPQLRVFEVASVSIDERGGWTATQDQLMGLRRKRGDDGRGWEVWSLSLGQPNSKFEEGYREGSTSLPDLLNDFESDEGSSPSTNSYPPPSFSRTSALRRRHFTLGSPSPLGRRNSNPSSSPSSDPLSLPFSRAGPFISSFSASAVTVGLGNQIVTFSPVSLQKDTTSAPRLPSNRF